MNKRANRTQRATHAGRDVFRSWEKVPSVFLLRPTSFVKDTLFAHGYCVLIKRICSRYHQRRSNLRVLKTDLWNEGVEPGRDILSRIRRYTAPWITELHGVDVAVDTCNIARTRLSQDIGVTRAITTELPFRCSSFDLILDISTIDHVPPAFIPIVLRQYYDALSREGVLMLVFDSGVNFLSEMYHRIYLRHHYPEWTLVPSRMRLALKTVGFEILEEYGCYVIGLLAGMHWRLPMIESFLRKRLKLVSALFSQIELSRFSRYLAPVTPQYAIVARKLA